MGGEPTPGGAPERRIVLASSNPGKVREFEQMLAPLDHHQIPNLLRSEEMTGEVIENTYPRRVYDYYFRACGFRPQFLPVIEHSRSTWKRVAMRAMPFLNGLLWEKWTIIGRPAAAPVLD